VVVVELRDIETFLALSEELHFGRTASRLRVTPGRVSQTIRALEREVGAPLFERTSRRVRLTVLGKQFHDGARRGYDELIRTLQDCRVAARHISETLHICYAPTIGGDFVTRIVAEFEDRHAGCTITLNAIPTDRTGIPRALLKDGKTDVALVWALGDDGSAMQTPELTIGPVLATVPRGVLVPAGHPLTEHQSVSLEDLVDYELLKLPDAADPALRDLWTPRFTPSGRPLKHTTDDLATMTGRTELLADDVLTLVARGHGLHCTVASLLERFPFPGLAVIPIYDMPPMVAVSVWLTAAENATIRAFARVAAACRQHPGVVASANSGR
jgi:DNA-binding transcriptional LysR family regulator